MLTREVRGGRGRPVLARTNSRQRNKFCGMPALVKM